METDSHPKTIAQNRTILEAQLRECYGRVVYSHKTHEKCADILLSRMSCIKLWQLILAALVTGGLISTFFGSDKVGAGISMVLSTALLVLNAYTKEYDLGETAQKHKQAANDIWLIREKYLSLLTDLSIPESDVVEIQSRRDALIDDLYKAYSGSPSTTFQAYKKAQKALQTQEDMTFSDEEIDAFLPKELKRS